MTELVVEKDIVVIVKEIRNFVVKSVKTVMRAPVMKIVIATDCVVDLATGVISVGSVPVPRRAALLAAAFAVALIRERRENLFVRIRHMKFVVLPVKLPISTFPKIGRVVRPDRFTLTILVALREEWVKRPVCVVMRATRFT